jgi:hypothetical protein
MIQRSLELDLGPPMSLLARPVLLDLKVPRGPKVRLVTPVLRTSKALRLVRLARQASATSRHIWQAGAVPVGLVRVPALARSVACRTRLRGGSRPGKNSLLWDTVRGTPMVSNPALVVPPVLPVLRAPQVVQVVRVVRVRLALLDKAGSRQTRPPMTRVRHKSRRRLGRPPTGSLRPLLSRLGPRLNPRL